MGAQDEVRPAFYALRAGGWRDYVTVLHLPYTLWNLSYVALGAALAPQFHTERMLWTMAAPLVEAQLGNQPLPVGNLSKIHAPHGVYRCAGGDE